MKIITQQNFPNYQTKSNMNNSLTFKARLIITPAAKEQLNTNFVNLKKNGNPAFFLKEPFDLHKYYKNLKKRLEDATKDISGDIKFIKGNEGRPHIQFITPDKKVYCSSDLPGQNSGIWAQELIFKGKPIISGIISRLSKLDSKNLINWN